MTPWLTPRLIPWPTPRLTNIVMFLCRQQYSAMVLEQRDINFHTQREPWNYCNFWKVEEQQFTAISPFGEEVLKHRGHFRSHNTRICLFKYIAQLIFSCISVTLIETLFQVAMSNLVALQSPAKPRQLAIACHQLLLIFHHRQSPWSWSQINHQDWNQWQQNKKWLPATLTPRGIRLDFSELQTP